MRDGSREPGETGTVSIRGCSMLGVLAGLLCCVAGVPAQDPFAAGAGDSIFVPAPRELTRPIELAYEALEEGRDAEVVDRLGEVLEAEGSETFFVPTEGTAGHWQNLRFHTQRLLDRLSPRARELFELKYGIEAARLLDEAVEARDWDAITWIAHDYLHCKAGYDAAMLLGRRHLDEGRYAAAARQFRRVLDSETGKRRWSPEVQWLAATALLASFDVEGASEVLDTLPGPSWRAMIGGNEIDSTKVPSAMADWLRERLGPLPALEADRQLDWALFRGNAQRNAVTSPGFPLLIQSWRVPTLLRADDRAVAEGFKQRLIDEGRPSGPALHALAIGDYVVMRTPEFVVGIELGTGLRTWYYPWDAPDLVADPAAANGGVQERPREEQLQERLWLDGAHGQMSGDGRSIYFLDRLGYRLQDAQRNRIPVLRGQAVAPAVNQLVALQLFDERGKPLEGKLNWMVGDADGLDQPWSAGVFFLGPPLPHDGLLYVLGERTGEVRLFAMDAQTAELKWSTSIATIDQATAEDRTLRQLGGCSPSLADNILVCPTSTGAVVAVDLTTRAPLWGYQYKPLATRNLGAMALAPWRPGDRWSDASVMIVDGLAILNPLELEKLIALDLATGMPRWSIDRGDLCYVAGAHGQRIVVVGRSSVRAVDPLSGETAWECSLAEFGPPSGRGYVASAKLYLPTTRRKVLSIDLDSGNAIDAVDTEYVLGNLIGHRGMVLSHDVDWVAAFPQDESNRVPVQEKLAANPTDKQALLLQAQLHVRDRRWSDAIDIVEVATREYPESLEVQVALVEIVMLALRNDESLPLERVTAHESAILQSAYRSEYVVRKIEQLLRTGQYDAMVESLLSAVRESNRRAVAGGESMLRRGDREFAVDVWSRSMVERAAADSSWNRQRAIAAIDAARLEAVTANDVARMTRLDALFGEAFEAPAFRLELARALIASGEALRAEQVLVSLRRSSDEGVRLEATALALDLMARHGFAEQAAGLAAEMVVSFPGARLADGSTTESLAERLSATPSSTGIGQRAISVQATGRGDVNSLIQFPFSAESIEGEWAPRDLRFSFLSSQLFVSDRHGRLLTTINVADGGGWMIRNTTNYRLRDHLLIFDVTFAQYAHEVVAVDLFKALTGEAQSVVWRQRLWGEAQRAIAFSRQVPQWRTTAESTPLGLTIVRHQFEQRTVGAYSSPTESGLLYLRGDSLVCVDSYTGEVRWRRSGMPLGGLCYASDQTGWVVGPDEVSVSAISMLDGADLPGHDRGKTDKLLWADGEVLVGLDVPGDRFRLVGWDLGDAAERWRLELPATTRAVRLDGQRLALFEPEGLFRILRCRDGQIEYEARVAAEPQFASIQVFEDAEGYLLVVNRNTATGRQRSRQLADVDLTAVGNSPLVDGVIHALGRDGRSIWPGPVMVDQYSLISSEVGKGPVLILTRAFLSKRDGQPVNLMDMVMIDRRDGRLLREETAIPSKVMQWTSTVDSATGAVLISGPREYVVKASDEPMPPAPAARTGYFGSGGTKPREIQRWIFDGVTRRVENQP